MNLDTIRRTTSPLATSFSFGTKAVHAGVKPDPSTGAIMTPIYQTSTYVQASPGNHKGYEYARTKNPTRTALQEALAELENAKHAICFSSGMAALDAVLKLLKPEDEVIATNDLYGGSYRLFTKLYADFGIQFHFVDMSEAKNINEYLNEKTRMIFIESPTNPLMRIIDIAAISKIAQEHQVLSVVDNTFASPYLQNPLDLGADISLHSITKYLAGHSDVVMGSLMLNDDSLKDRLTFIQNSCGAVPGPQDCFLTMRGLKTLHLRMKAHSANGAQVAHFLNSHPKVAKVYWPGFSIHPNHHIAKTQMRDFGGMMSFSLADDRLQSAFEFMRKLRIFSLAESLGGVESLVGHPASMTHVAIPREERLKAGLVDSLIRLSVGVEDEVDLIADLAQALEQL